MKSIILLICLVVHVNISANDQIDSALSEYIQRFNLKAIERIEDNNPSLTRLGMQLFHDNRLSLTKTVSCSTCHMGREGTSESLPLSMGVGAEGRARSRNLKDGVILARHSTSIINKGQPGIQRMFWDGRVRLHPRENHYITPVEGLNGDNPEYFEIVEALNGVLAAQALFPIVNKDEMRGYEHDQLSEKEIWDLVTKRILEDDNYKTAFSEIFPNESINIGHIASAIAHFEKTRFQVTNTKYDQYLRGDLKVLSRDEKKGFLIFAEKARCVHCHFGPNLSNQTLQNIVVPPIGPGTNGRGQDFGAFEHTRQEKHKYRFVVQPLRGINLTAPYFHNGSMLTLEDVVNHYNDPFASIDNYDGKKVNEIFSGNYNGPLRVNRHPYQIFSIKEKVSPLIKKLNLSNEEKSLLVKFLKTL